MRILILAHVVLQKLLKLENITESLNIEHMFWNKSFYVEKGKFALANAL